MNEEAITIYHNLTHILGVVGIVLNDHDFGLLLERLGREKSSLDMNGQPELALAYQHAIDMLSNAYEAT